jgi:hypothetical protein
MTARLTIWSNGSKRTEVMDIEDALHSSAMATTKEGFERYLIEPV